MTQMKRSASTNSKKASLDYNSRLAGKFCDTPAIDSQVLCIITPYASKGPKTNLYTGWGIIYLYYKTVQKKYLFLKSLL